MSGTVPNGKRPRVAMMVANTIKSDGRVQKAASAVASFGYDVHLFGVSPDDEVHRGRVGQAALTLVPVPWVLRNATPPTPVRERVRQRTLTWLSASDDTAYEAKRRRIELELREIESRRGRAGRRSDVSLSHSIRRGQLSAHSRLIDLAYQWSPDPSSSNPGGWRTKLPELHDYEIALGDKILQFAPDVIHAHDVHLLGVAVRTAERMGARRARPSVIYDSHEFVPGIATTHPWKAAALADMEREYIGRADRIITVSALLAEWLERDHNPDNPVSVVMNTPAASWDDEVDEVPSLREAAGVPDGSFIILYSGGYSPFRGVHTLVDSMVHLPECHLVLVAPLPHAYVSQLLSRAEERGVGERVHVAPFVAPHQVSRYLSQADIGVHPMLHAPNHEVALPNKYFEYLHAGLPIVVSDVKFMSQQTRLDGVGEVFVAEDAVDLAGAVRRVLADRDRYTSNITAELLHEYSWERQAEHLRDVYADLGLSVAPATGPVETSVRVDGVAYPDPEQTVEDGETLLIGPLPIGDQVSALSRALSAQSGMTVHTAGFVSTSSSPKARLVDVPIPRNRWNEEPWQRVHVHQIKTTYSHVLLTGATSLVGSIYGGLLGDEVVMLEKHGIRTALLLDAESVRDPQLHTALEPGSPFRSAPRELIEAAAARSQHTLRIAESATGPVFVGTVDLFDEVRDAAWLPLVVDVSDTSALRTAALSPVPTIVHAPLDPFLAGSVRIDEVGHRLEQEGLISYQTTHHANQAQRDTLIAGADIVIDDVATGHHSAVGLQALTIGRIVLANDAHRVLARLPERAPMINTDMEGLEQAIRSILHDGSAALETAASGPDFVRRYHDGVLTSLQLTRWIDGLPPYSIEALAERAQFPA